MFIILGAELFLNTLLQKSEAYVARYTERDRHREEGGDAAG